MRRRNMLWITILLAALFLPPLADAAELQVHDAALATSVENRLPQGVGETFPASVDRLYAFTRVVGAGNETAVTHNWYYAGRRMAEVKLPVRASNWRTWSSKAIMPSWTGQWLVEVVGEDGSILESLSFMVE
jgi:hypothetical protein